MFRYLHPRFILLLLVVHWSSCANQKILDPSPKIGFDINALDKEGLLGDSKGRVAVNYEFCIPANNAFIVEVRGIDPSLSIHKRSPGRVACTAEQWLCIGSTHQEYARLKLQRLAELHYVKRIERTHFE